MVRNEGSPGWDRCSEGLVGGWASPEDAEGNKHHGEEAEGNQADDKRQQDGLVTGTRETWQKDMAIRHPMVVAGIKVRTRNVRDIRKLKMGEELT